MAREIGPETEAGQDAAGVGRELQAGADFFETLGAFEDDQRSYLTVAIGCTGGQPRSVYLSEQLARRFADHGAALVRHRELDERS